MPISKAQAERMQKSRRKLKKKKDEFLLKPVEPTKRQEIKRRNDLLSAVDKTKNSVIEMYGSVNRLEDFQEQLDDVYENMIWWDDLNLDIGSVIDELDEFHREAFYETITTASGVNVAGFVNEQGLGDLIKTMTEVNAQQITDLRDGTQRRVAELVQNAIMGQEVKTASLEQQIREGFKGPASNQARFIARDQTQRVVNGFTRFRQERAGIKKYKWATSKDNRVREGKGHNHKIMDGLEVEWETGKIVRTPLSVKRGVAGKNVKNVAGGHIGAEYQCRCRAIAILEL